MKYKRVTTSALPISLQEAKAHLRVTHALEDNLIEALIPASVFWAEDYTGRSFCSSQIEAYTESNLSAYRIGRFLEIDAIDKVYGAQGQEFAFEFDGFDLVTITDTLADENYPLKIEYSTKVDSVPNPAKQAMLLKISELYEYRADSQISISRTGDYRRKSEDLLQMYKLDNYVV